MEKRSPVTEAERGSFVDKPESGSPRNGTATMWFT
jgi:hypothetical protein